jgi:predicted nucleotide-binding protein
MKKNQESPQQPLRLQMPAGEAGQKIADRVEKGKAILERPISSEKELDKIRGDYYTWSDYNHELLRQLFSNESMAEEFSYVGPVSVSSEDTFYDWVNDFHDDVKSKIRRLESIAGRLELIPLAENTKSILDRTAKPRSGTDNKVFIVHGHDEAAREMVARFIEKMDLEPIILHEQASGGRTIIEKLEHYGNVSYAVVLLTPDDEGRAKQEGESLRDRARQNVILELGYFIGLLSRSHVSALHRGSVEIPTDYLGVLFIPLDDGGGWQLRLARELKAAGYDIDMNKAV